MGKKKVWRTRTRGSPRQRGKHFKSRSVPQTPNTPMEVHHNPWGRRGQLDIRRERDAVPNVNPDSDIGWLANFERDIDQEYDDKEKMLIMDKLKKAKLSKDEAESAIAIAELKTEYPSVWNAVTKK